MKMCVAMRGEALSGDSMFGATKRAFMGFGAAFIALFGDDDVLCGRAVEATNLCVPACTENMGPSTVVCVLQRAEPIIMAMWTQNAFEPELVFKFKICRFTEHTDIAPPLILIHHVHSREAVTFQMDRNSAIYTLNHFIR